MGKAWTSVTPRSNDRHGVTTRSSNGKELEFLIRHFARKGWHIARDPHDKTVLLFAGASSMIGKVRKPPVVDGEVKLPYGDGEPEASFETALQSLG